MTSEIRTRQLPGRQDALRLALGKTATPLMKHIAGLDKTFNTMQGKALEELRAREKLTAQEHEALNS